MNSPSSEYISLMFDDVTGDQIIATVSRTLSDIEEGLGPEIEDYVVTQIRSSGA